MDYYPAFLDLRDRNCLVAGGGAVAERKVESLLECGALVKVVTREATSVLTELARSGSIELGLRDYISDDLMGIFLVIAATDDPTVQARIGIEAKERGLLVNVVDDPANCTFIVPAVARRGALSIAVSTGGRSPALAARIREKLEGLFGPEYEEWVDLLGQLRETLAVRFPDTEERKGAWYRVVDSNCLELIRRGERDLMRKQLDDLLGPGQDSGFRLT
ncbi:MAG TPA: bifunctional precorrin-2 dehydrogenase/sirohydrochlorin ferrochelatase [Blastocatellia bacterium]|nr:bifunctional precorrin-2 dehydrogenase/sirohydrochlorin ferrochelatase [Blastocatellia bacterium]